MKQYIFYIVTILLLVGCTTGDYTAIANATVSKNPSHAFEVFAKNKSIQYASNLKRLSEDLKFLSHFVESISKEWGKKT
jgi:membrane-bound lytic murein transglycosylase C